MSKPPRYTSPGYRRAVWKDTQEWVVANVRQKDKAIREALEAEKAAVLADLEKNKRGE